MTETAAPPTITIRPTTVAAIREHGEALLRAHAQEAEPDLAEHFDPCWTGYEGAEKCGQLIVLAAWNGAAELIGYAVAVVVPSMHYALTLCQHDLLYVAPEHRARGLGRRLLKRLIEEATARGAQRLLMHAKAGSTLWSMLMVDPSFDVEETIFKRTL